MKVTVFHKPRPEGNAQRIAVVVHAGNRLDILRFIDDTYVVRTMVAGRPRLVAMVANYAAALRVAKRELGVK